MLRRVDGDEGRTHLTPPHAQAVAAEQTVTPVGESDGETSLLPHDHPKWARDAVTVSARMRELIAALRPVIVKVLTFWDHRVRSAFVGGARVCIDPSGSYRIDP
ncbi:MAG TPA: hypothetical protein VMD47_06680 [Candidatus Acidoferrales bacterium]|nr:hypothetical protein [Candidatus Acidoferrales bacterium]